MQGLKIAKDNNLMPLKISTDSIELLRDLKLSHTYREQNKVADLLAKEGANRRLFERTRILQVPPMFANESVWTVILGTTYSREISTHN
ncbi:hypothetical protein H5410_008784, partial [Solanum commersonii]